MAFKQLCVSVKQQDGAQLTSKVQGFWFGQTFRGTSVWKRDVSNKIQDVLSLGAVQEFHTSVVSSLGATIEYLASC